MHANIDLIAMRYRREPTEGRRRRENTIRTHAGPVHQTLSGCECVVSSSVGVSCVRVSVGVMCYAVVCVGLQMYV